MLIPVRVVDRSPEHLDTYPRLGRFRAQALGIDGYGDTEEEALDSWTREYKFRTADGKIVLVEVSQDTVPFRSRYR